MTATEQALREHNENVRFLEMQLQDPTADQAMLGQQLKERQALRDKTATELQELAFSNAQMQQLMKLTRFPLMVQKVNGGYVLVGMPDQQQQQAEQQGAIARVNVEQSTDFERVLEGQYIPLSDMVQARQAQQAA